MKDTPEARQSYIDAIIKLLDKADMKSIRIIWIVVSGLVK